MSRSRKKNKIGKDYNKNSKRISHKKFRAFVKNCLYHNKSLPNKQSEVENSYNIHDYIWQCDKDCRCVKKYGFYKCLNK